jgi:hypothetical protein
MNSTDLTESVIDNTSAESPDNYDDWTPETVQRSQAYFAESLNDILKGLRK